MHLSVIRTTIAERIKDLNNAEQRWLESYKKSLEEWQQRNMQGPDEYDLTYTLTPLQSRLEALRQKGHFE